LVPPPPRPTLFPYTTLFRSLLTVAQLAAVNVPNPSVKVAESVGTPSVAEAAALLTARELGERVELAAPKTSSGDVTVAAARILPDRKSTRLNSSHRTISYAV